MFWEQDYVRTARAKGLKSAWWLFFATPCRMRRCRSLQSSDWKYPSSWRGAVVTETIFAWPGMGRLFIDHIERADFPVLMGILMLIAFAVVIFQISQMWCIPL